MAPRLGKTATFPRVPYGAPRWPKGDALLFAAGGFLAASAAPLSVAVIKASNPIMFGDLKPGKVLVPALASGLVLAWKTLNAHTPAKAIGWALLGGPVAGAISGLLTALHFIVLDHQRVLLVCSALLGVPFGIPFGLALACLAGAAAHVRFPRSHDAFDRLLGLLGIWLIAIYGAMSLALEGQVLETVARIGLLLGALALMAGVARQTARIVWLKRVRAGRVPNWTLRAWDLVTGVDRLHPLFGAKPLSCDAVLVHHADTPGLPYRGARGEVAVALAPGGKMPGPV